METPEAKIPPVYRYEALAEYFEAFATPAQTADHLDQLLFCLVYFEHKEGIQAYLEVYGDIFELKRVLQTMITEEGHGNS